MRVAKHVKRRDRHYNFDERGMFRARCAYTPFARVTVPPLNAKATTTRLFITKPMIVEITVSETADESGSPRGVSFEICHEPLTLESAFRANGWSTVG